MCLIPTAGGAITYGSSHGFDAAFDVGLSVASTLTVNPVTITPDIAVAVGTTATLSTHLPAVGWAAVRLPMEDRRRHRRHLTNIPRRRAPRWP